MQGIEEVTQNYGYKMERNIYGHVFYAVYRVEYGRARLVTICGTKEQARGECFLREEWGRD